MWLVSLKDIAYQVPATHSQEKGGRVLARDFLPSRRTMGTFLSSLFRRRIGHVPHAGIC